jgi:GNAT superfamily N-acetyltransferase
LLVTLEERGIVLVRSEEVLAAEVSTFVVIEREARLIACAQLKPLGTAEGSGFASVAEVASFAVHHDFRGVGRGDSLLDWIEQDARHRCHDCLVLLTTRTADWFQVRIHSCSCSCMSLDLATCLWSRPPVSQRSLPLVAIIFLASMLPSRLCLPIHSWRLNCSTSDAMPS